MISSSERGHPVTELVHRHAEGSGNLCERLFLLANEIERGRSGKGRDPPGARGDRLLADDLEQAHLANVVEMRAPAQFPGEFSHPDDADDVRVLLAEEGHGAGLPSPRRWACGSRTPAIAGHDQAVDGLLDLFEPFLADGVGVGEVEAEAIRLHLAAGLLGVLAQVAVEGVVQEVGRGMGAADGLPAVGVHGGRRLASSSTVPSVTRPMWRMKSWSLRVSSTVENETRAANGADVADLAAGLGVEGGPIEDQGDRRAGAVGRGRPTRQAGPARGCR